MTWLEFNTEVNGFLPLDAQREGAQTYLANLKRAAVIDLQQNIRFYRYGLESVYSIDTMVTEGEASRGTLPPQAKVREVYRVVLDDAGVEESRLKLEQVPWGDRGYLIQALATGVALSPFGDLFYVAPAIEANMRVSLLWDGIARTFGDEDTVRFGGTKEAEAVALYLRAELARMVDNDLQASATYRRDYLGKRQELLLAAKDLAEMT